MNTRKDNRKIINELRNEFIHQLKNSSWNGDEDTFHNEYFHIRYSASYKEKWVVEFLKKVDGENYTRTLPVYFLVNKFHFLFLRKFYVKYSIRNNKKIRQEEEIANFTKKFFDKNKSLKRDIKLKQLLNE